MNKKVKNAVAILASAATLLAMGAFGVGSANAAESPVEVGDNNGTIVVHNVPAGHTLTAVEIGTYQQASSSAAGSLDNVAVATPSALKSQILTAANTARDAYTGSPALSAVDTENPMGWVANNFLDSKDSPYKGNLRNFVTALVKGDTSTSPATPALSFDVSATSYDTTEHTATFSGLPVGIYVIKDTLTTGHGDETASIPMLVGTTIGNDYTTLNGADLGKVDMKNQLETFVTSFKKYASKLNTTDLTDSNRAGKLETAKIGDKVEFTLEGEVPNVVGFDGFTYTMTDKATAGLHYDGNAVVTVDGALKTSDVTITPASGNDPMTFVFSYDKLKGYTPGKTIKITYTDTLTTLTPAHTWQKNTNDATLEYSNDPADSTSTAKIDAKQTKLAMYSVKLNNKKKADGSVMTGGKFKIYEGDSATGNPLNFKGDAGSYTYDATATGTGTTTEVATDNDGNVVVDGLPDGTYTFQQTDAADGYTHSTFKVIIKNNVDGTADALPNTDDADFTNTADAFGLVGKNTIKQNTLDHWQGIIEVDNANAINQLPLTGGAGIAMLVALIMVSGCIAGGTAVLRRRSAMKRN
ncbi:isopeptide-forming domain-containing fimbrial protein [Bifidobacterium sp. ESL0764]|uniref:isopeptide-forming domain-containing fimbrial protein n=1 Tax=Bifidobacterium sp. ESL0764 TaxID=2983228 RepID=UPI0023FA25B8|nr:isopeptide-forming domain-containing fimbrial protein [Bifidobacterium sp. ESL0764]WEV65790.1 isopeptide-forming domain-containing fimbrial protein [Bifidobacterium sp. ESL0764]